MTIIGSASTTSLGLRAGLVEELRLDILPVFLKKGFRPFEGLKDLTARLERIKTVEVPGGRTHSRFRVVG